MLCCLRQLLFLLDASCIPYSCQIYVWLIQNQLSYMTIYSIVYEIPRVEGLFGNESANFLDNGHKFKFFELASQSAHVIGKNSHHTSHRHLTLCFSSWKESFVMAAINGLPG